ncbi:MAG: hypothetical protein JMJ88_00455 [Synergistaceae bacterium]|nr:hypothetical protein [Synergistaceae bacterium]
MASDKSQEKLRHKSVIVFYGAAGTGKSRRAQLIAREYNVDFIVDDGLVIHRGQIVCGKSAKSERNQIRAIRRALFQYDDHKKQVMKYLADQSGALMIIATSKEMARKIIAALELPNPSKYISIEDVATKDEIQKARSERIEKGQHVIPVSQVQVRRNFAGQLVGKLRVFWQPAHPQDGEKAIVRPPFTFYGELHIESDAIEQMVEYIAGHTDQVLSIESLKVRSNDDSMTVSLSIKVTVGEKSFLNLSHLLQRRVRKGIEYFTGIAVKRVDINIADIVLL